MTFFGRRRAGLGALGLIIGALAGGAGARAAEIRVITTGAMKEVVLRLGAQFEKASGHRLTVTNDTAGGVARKIEAGAAFDLAVITPAFVDELMAKGKLLAGSRADIARVGVGVAVREGAPRPDISTVETFRAALLAAKSVAYIDPASGGSSGIYFAGLIERLGIADAVKAKAKLQSGGYVAELVAKGEAEIAIHQISEILPVQGVVFIGPLPAAIQRMTVYAAGLAPQPQDPAAAKALLAYLAGPDAAAVLTAAGMEVAGAP
jgi:molybdate transport system substrate-binding protein